MATHAPDPADLFADDPDRDRLRQLGRKVRGRLAAAKGVTRIPAAWAELWAVAGFLDSVECGRLIALIDAVAKPSTTAGTYARGFRTSYSGDLDQDDPFVAGIGRRIDRLLGLDRGQGEALQGQRYLPGQEFKPHVDWFPHNSAAWREEQRFGGQRAFTAMAYLNRVEDGGETDFPRLDIAVAPRPGTLLVWNNADRDGVPNPWTFHAGNPVARGAKYIFTKWYRCRPCDALAKATG